MWKKLIIVTFTFFATFSIVFAIEKQELHATRIRTSGIITGRIGSLKKGDRILLDTANLQMQVIEDRSNTNSPNGKYPNDTWFLLSSKPVTETPVMTGWKSGLPSSFDFSGQDSIINTKVLEIQKALDTNAIEKYHVQPRLFNNDAIIDKDVSNYQQKDQTLLFSPVYWELFAHRVGTKPSESGAVISSRPIMNLQEYDVAADFDWWGNNAYSKTGMLYFNANAGYYAEDRDTSSTHHIRIGAYMNFSDVVFSTSIPTGINGLGQIHEVNYVEGTRMFEVDGDPMKVRVYDPLRSPKIEFTKIKHDNIERSIVPLDSTIDIYAKAEYATGFYGTNTVSAMIFDEDGEWLYYQQLDVAKGNDKEYVYTLDTTGIPYGTYNIALVNEMYSDAKKGFTYSSLITEKKELHIVPDIDAVHADSKTNLEFKKNVEKGDAVANISVSATINGILHEIAGIPPIRYVLTDDPEHPDHQNDANYFEVLENDLGISQVVVSAETGLKAGTYYLRLYATDVYGNPNIDDEAVQVYCNVTITVNKTTPKIEFLDKSTREVPYVSEKTLIEQVTYNNDDSNVLVSYETSSDVVTVHNDGNNHAKITLNTSDALGKSTITATLQESDNYLSATTTKQINVYAGITDFKFTPSKTPILTTDTVNANYLIGQLSLQNGVANYSYSIESDPNGNIGDNTNSTSFKVDTSQTANKTMNVYTTGQLTAGTYKVTFKVIDQNNQELYLPVTITVSPAGQTGFEFYDYETTAKITGGTKEIEYGTSNAKVLASGGLGTGSISYKIKDGQPNDVIDLDTSNGNITAIHKTGSVIVQATKAKDSNYNAATIEMTVKIVEGTQTLTFSPVTSKKFVLNDPIPISASLTRTDGSSGAITYVSNDPSICTIDDSDTSNVKAVMKAEGDCSITASNSDTYYKAVSDTKKISLYGGITGTFVQVIDPLNQGDAKAQVGSTDTIAKVTSLAGGDGIFHLVKLTVKKAGVDVTSMFDMDASWNITPKQDLTYGEYDFSIEIEDGNNEASTITGTLSIGLETNNSFKITKDSTVITELTTDYVTALNPKIILGTQGKKGTGTVHFTLVDSVKDPSETDDAISINDTGTITVNRAMTSNDLYYVQAYIDEDKTNGYAKQETKKVKVVVNESPQEITFDSTVPASVKYDVDQTFDISASLDRTPGDITYSSTTPSICVVEDSTKPIAKIKGKGICVVKAENNDQNYENTFKTTSITIFDGMAAGFTQTITPLKQGDSALDPASNTVIGKITGLAGNQGAVTYGLKVLNNLVDVSNDFKINDDGEVLPVNTIKYGTYDIEVTLTDGTGSSGSIKVTGTIVVGLEENNSFKITYKGSPTVSISESYTNAITGMSVGSSGKKGNGQVHYHLSVDSVKDPKETLDAIIVNDDGTIKVSRAMTSDDVYQVYAYVEEDLINGYAKQETAAVPIVITDAPMPNMSWLVDGVSASEIHTDYGPNKKIQLGVDQAPAGSTIEYTLVEDGTGKHNGIDVSDVVSVDQTTGKVTILHANLTAQIGQVQIKAKVVCPGYTDTELTPINVQIDKAEQTSFKFAQQVYTMPYGTGSFTPAFLYGAPHDDGVTYNNKLSCSDPYDVRVNASSPDTFVYDVQEAEGASITIKARNLGNRDYKAKEATAILKVLGENESLFDVSVNPSPVITYGETVTITPDLPESADITYTYESMDDTILVQDETALNKFHSIKEGTAQVKVTKQETGAADCSVYVSIRVKPKPITVELDGTYEIKAGQAIPSFVLKDISTSLVHGDTLPTPNVSVAIQNTLTPGSYPITVSYPSDDITKNYAFTQTPCDLVIIQDQPVTQWYKVYPESDVTKTQSDLTKWYKEPLIMETIHSEYDELSGNGMSNWGSTLKFDEEGSMTHTAYFKSSSTNALSSPTTITTKIDYTKPIVKSMTGSIVNEAGLWKLLHDVSFGTFFKPKTSVIFTVEDPKPQEAMEVSGVAKILYKVYLADGDTKTLDSLIPDGRITSNEIRNGKAAIVLQDPGDYYVCAKAVDLAGNEGSEVCSYLKVKGKGYDSDGDGIPDLNIDLNDDGTPDLNITRKECKVEEIGVTENCKVPYTNIDTNGDGEADTNIDLNGDGEPELNIGKVHEWKPYIEVDIDNDGKVDFKTGAEIPWELNIDSDKDRKPDINIDVNKDGIADINLDTDNDFSKPEINIDNIGDGKPHINIDDNEDGKPDRNIVIFTRWEPNDDVNGSITYDTMYNLKANDTLIHKDTDIIVQSPPDNAFLPQYALKVEDQTKKQASVIQEELELNEKQKVEQVYRISIVDEAGNVIDVHDVITVKIPISDDIHNPVFYMKKENGEVLKLNAIKKDGYYEFETEELGLVSIVGEEIEPSTPEPNDPNTDKPNTDQPKADEPTQTTPTDTNKPATSVQGTYVKGKETTYPGNNVGGAITGDETNTFLYMGLVLGTLGTLCFLCCKRKQH